jgi:aconitate hydratase
MSNIKSDKKFVENTYSKLQSKLEIVKAKLNRPLTLTEKILYSHLKNPEKCEFKRGEDYIYLNPDRVALQDATAQMAVLQFSLAGRQTSAVPTTIHCDHLIRAFSGAKDDLAVANDENAEVYKFLQSASKKYGFGFCKPGSGIIHQVVIEKFAFPGLMMLGTDSHTPNAGGIGAFASGVGGADAVDVMVGLDWELLHPEIVGVKLTGKLNGFASSKDVILKLLDILTVKGGTNRVIEYFGEGCANLSTTAKATICNMGAELGATTSIFPTDEHTFEYLSANSRDELNDVIKANINLLTADAGAENHYDKVIEINLDELVPLVVGPHSPDLAASVDEMAEHLVKNDSSVELSSALIGSCTNSSYEDMSKITKMAQFAKANGLKLKTPLLITPGSEQILQTITRDGQLAELKEMGAVVLANACGPCIGQWKRADGIEKNSIISSYNRNFPKRNDGNPNTHSFLASPETVFAYALHGRLDCNPFTTPILNDKGQEVILGEIGSVDALPKQGFTDDASVIEYYETADEKTDLAIADESDRLQKLSPFPSNAGSQLNDLPVLLKAQGKCTTDHISPAGVWLKYRGHLQNISNNAFNGAVNRFTGKPGIGYNILTGQEDEHHKIALNYKANSLTWVAIGDENYGEGSSREHAAMCPRFLGGRAVIAKSFARIHETNLKKQGLLPLHFINKDDYNLIEKTDRISIDVSNLANSKTVDVKISKNDGAVITVQTRHTFNAEQIEWFKAGSALNKLRNDQAK